MSHAEYDDFMEKKLTLGLTLRTLQLSTLEAKKEFGTEFVKKDEINSAFQDTSADEGVPISTEISIIKKNINNILKAIEGDSEVEIREEGKIYVEGKLIL